MTMPVAPVVYYFKVDSNDIYDAPAEVELNQRWGHHELMLVRIMAAKGHPYKQHLATWADRAPVEVLYGRGPGNMATWYGYVNHHTFSTVDDEDAGTLQVTYTLIGTSHVMDSVTSHNWQQITYSQIAARIARKYKFRCVVTTTQDQVEELQVSESDFCFLNRMAHKIGFRFHVSGGTMYFIDPLVLLAPQSHNFVPQYWVDKNEEARDTAQRFRQNEGHNLPGSQISVRTLSGFDQGTGLSFTVAADTTDVPDPYLNFSIADTHRHVTSIQEARRVVNATQSLAQFWSQATVEVFGRTLIYPGKVIYLLGYGMPFTKQGHWLVTGSRHLLRPGYSGLVTDDMYTTQLEIMRSTTGTAYYKGIQHISPETIPCRLVNNIWVATRTGVIQDGISMT